MYGIAKSSLAALANRLKESKVMLALCMLQVCVWRCQVFNGRAGKWGDAVGADC